MSEVYLEAAPKMGTINYEKQVKSAMQKIVEKVEHTQGSKAVVQASLDVKRVFTKALNEGPQNQAFQKRISNIFCNARETLRSVLIQAKIEKI